MVCRNHLRSAVPAALLALTAPAQDSVERGAIAVMPRAETPRAAAPSAETTLAAATLASPSLANAHGVSVDDGVAWGVGRDYRVRFDPDGIEFTPALGERAARARPLRFALESVGREHGAPLRASPARLEVDGDLVRYVRCGVVEWYDVRAEHVEQGFTFAALPRGGGDLVVRGRVTSELAGAPVAASGEGLEFGTPGADSIAIGAVTGIDARGARTPGSLAFHDGVLELRLPAAFVDSATLPIVLDPTIGSGVTVSNLATSESPDVAVLDGIALVVWQRRYASGDTDILAQRLQLSDGALVGSAIAVRTGSVASLFPRVAPVGLRDRFVIVWAEQASGPSYIAARSIGLDGSLSNTLQVVASATDSFFAPDVGGDVDDLGGHAVAVWQNSTQARVEGARIHVAADGTLSSSGRTTLAGPSALQPSIAETCGPAGRYMVAWLANTTPNLSISALVMDRDLGVLHSRTVTRSGAGEEIDPDVDGDGTHWVVAYETGVAGAHDVRCAWFSWNDGAGQAIAHADVVVEADANDDETDPVVCFQSNSAIVIYLDAQPRTGTDFQRIASIDLFSCVPCEANEAFGGGSGWDVRNPAAAFDRSVGRALFAYEQIHSGASIHELRAGRYLEEAGAPVRVSPSGCGRGGVAHAGCARHGHADFHLRVDDAEPNRPAFALLGFTGAFRTLGCGPCGLGVDPFRGHAVWAGSTDAFGHASLNVPLPSAVSFAQYAVVSSQWAILASGAAACPALGVDFSTLRVVDFD